VSRVSISLNKLTANGELIPTHDFYDVENNTLSQLAAVTEYKPWQIFFEPQVPPILRKKIQKFNFPSGFIQFLRDVLFLYT